MRQRRQAAAAIADGGLLFPPERCPSYDSMFAKRGLPITKVFEVSSFRICREIKSAPNFCCAGAGREICFRLGRRLIVYENERGSD